MRTWLAWGAATNKIGPCLGTFHDPRGWTSRKKRSTKTDISHRKVSYVQLFMGYSFVAGVGEPALVGRTPLEWEGILEGVLCQSLGSCETVCNDLQA